MEDNNMEITVKDALKMVIEKLEDICVPAKYADEISRPLCQGIGMLKTCVSSIEAAEQKKAEENAANEQMGDVDFGTAEEPAGEPEGEADA